MKSHQEINKWRTYQVVAQAAESHRRCASYDHGLQDTPTMV